METPSNYLPRPMRKLNQLYSRGYGGAPTPMSNPSRLEEPSVRLPQIGMLRHAGSVNPLIRGGAAISASRRALLEELQPHRPSAVSVLPSGSRGSGASRVSPMAPVRKLPDPRVQHISLDQGYPSPERAGPAVLLQARVYKHDKLYTPSGQLLNHKRQYQGLEKNRPSGASGGGPPLATPVWWG